MKKERENKKFGRILWKILRRELVNGCLVNPVFTDKKTQVILTPYQILSTCFLLLKTLRPRSHRRIRYTVFAIRYTFCSPPQTRFHYFYATSLKCRLWWRANRLVYSKYRIAYTSMWTRPSATNTDNTPILYTFRIFPHFILNYTHAHSHPRAIYIRLVGHSRICPPLSHPL